MRKPMSLRRRTGAAALVLCASVALGGCIGGAPTNRSMYSVHQPVVTTSAHALDLTTGGAGLAYGEHARLLDWFGTMGLKYGDRIVLDEPSGNPAVLDAVSAVAGRYGVAVDTQASRPTGAVPVGLARITVNRATAAVPGCPDWAANSDANPNNALSSNFGCAVNANLAAMVADPQDLVRGATDTGSTQVMTSNKAIGAYRTAVPTGNGTKVSDTGTRED